LKKIQQEHVDNKDFSSENRDRRYKKKATNFNADQQYENYSYENKEEKVYQDSYKKKKGFTGGFKFAEENVDQYWNIVTTPQQAKVEPVETPTPKPKKIIKREKTEDVKKIEEGVRDKVVVSIGVK